MADLSDIQAAQSVKIIGTDATGLETNPVNGDSNGNLYTTDKTSSTTTGSGSALNATPIASVDLTNYANLYIQLTGTFSATVTFEGSLDNSNWVSVNAQTVSDTSTLPVQTTTTTGIYKIPILFRYFRLRISVYTSGTINASAIYTNDPGNDLGRRSVDTSFTVLGGQLVPTITNKFRVRYSTSSATAGSAYTTIFTRSGTGLFFGFQCDFNNANVRLRCTIDSGQIFEITVADVKLFQFNDTSTTRMQMGGFWATVGNTVDFSSKFPIPYTTSITIEMQRSDATNHTLNQYIVFLTEDT